VGEVPEHASDVGRAHVQPGVPEGEAGELAGGPHQCSGAGGGAQAEGEELVAGAGERRGVGGPMPARRQGWPGVMPHPRHPLTPSRRRHGVLLARRPAGRGTPRGTQRSGGERRIPGTWRARRRGERRWPCGELSRRACGGGRPRASAPARSGPAGGGGRTPWRALVGGACNRRTAGHLGARRRRSSADAHRSRGNACLRLEQGQAGCYDQAASRGALPRGCEAPGAGGIRPRGRFQRPREARGSPDVSGSVNGTRWNGGERDGTRQHPEGLTSQLNCDVERLGGTERHGC
jgi:hypothetical protein